MKFFSRKTKIFFMVELDVPLGLLELLGSEFNGMDCCIINVHQLFGERRLFLEIGLAKMKEKVHLILGAFHVFKIMP